MIRLIILFVIMMISGNQGHARGEFSYPGGIAEIRIARQAELVPEVRFGLKNPVIMEYPDYWRILIGLGLETLPGEYVVYIKPSVKGVPSMHEKIVVTQKIYPFVETDNNLDSNYHWSVRKQHLSYSDIDFSNTQQPSLPLQFPLEGNWSSTFGHRLYESSVKELHVPNALSLATTQLANVVAPHNAIVSRIKTDDSGRSTVFLDHGRGLYSIISGISDLTIETGNGIVAGAVIGRLSNSSIENQTKQLVWQTVMNGAYVNPRILTLMEP